MNRRARLMAAVIGGGVLLSLSSSAARPHGAVPGGAGSLNPPTASESESSTGWLLQADSGAGPIETLAPFRADRRPAQVRYRLNDDAASSPLASVRPVLTLRAILWGVEPIIVLEGLGDRQRLLRVNDTIGGLQIVRIGRFGARIAGLDTVWNLRLPEGS
jgi:hypothetical protein